MRSCRGGYCQVKLFDPVQALLCHPVVGVAIAPIPALPAGLQKTEAFERIGTDESPCGLPAGPVVPFSGQGSALEVCGQEETV